MKVFARCWLLLILVLDSLLSTKIFLTKILGLDICADTLVGDEMLKGISGGQKKRLTTGAYILCVLIYFGYYIFCTIKAKLFADKATMRFSGELLIGPARVLFMDEISTGLDSSTTYQIIKYLRHSTRALDATTVISLLQPAPETYELFDDVILLCEGQIVFQGPREAALDFFSYMGFSCPQRKNVADFLQEVSSEVLELYIFCSLSWNPFFFWSTFMESLIYCFFFPFYTGYIKEGPRAVLVQS